MDFNFEYLEFCITNRRFLSRLSNDTIDRYIKGLKGEKKSRFRYNIRIFVLNLKDNIRKWVFK